MPRVTFVKSARKDNHVCKKGESYYHWKFRFGGKRFSLTYPKQSQLTQSAYKQTVYGLQEYASETGVEPGNADDVESMRDEITSQLEELRDQCEESRENMPEALQDSPTGELLQERYDAIDSAISEIENIEAPDQWQEVEDATEAYNDWSEAEPVREDYDEGDDGKDEFEAQREAWDEQRPDEPEEFEDFDTDEFVQAMEECHV